MQGDVSKAESFYRAEAWKHLPEHKSTFGCGYLYLFKEKSILSC